MRPMMPRSVLLSVLSATLIAATAPVHGQAGPDIACADVNGDARVNLSDAVWLLNRLFVGGAQLQCNAAVAACGEVNADGDVNLTDAVVILNWLFRGGSAPDCRDGTAAIDGFTSLGLNAQGYPEYLHDLTQTVFVLLPGGRVLVGAQPDNPAGRHYDPASGDKFSFDDPTPEVEGPVHEVTLSPFLMGKYEVTQEQWGAVMGSNPSQFQGGDPSQLPVESVSWNDIQAFEAATGLVLPSEAQWEYACRAGTEGQYGGTGSLDDMGWYRKNSDRQTHAVGTRAPNDFGLHDLHGNVTEWCEDVYEPRFYLEPEASGTDPVATCCLPFHVLRGGDWARHEVECRSAFRVWAYPELSGSLAGFRASVSFYQDLRLQSDRLDFGSLALGRAVSLRLGIRNVGTVPLEVKRIVLSGDTDGAFEVMTSPRTVSPLKRAEVEVRYRPVTAGQHRPRLVIETDDPTEPSASVQLLGSGVEPGTTRKIQGFTSLGLNEQGFPEYLHDLTEIIFVLLPGGTTWMGAQRDDPQGRSFDRDAGGHWFPAPDPEEEGPIHQVTLSPFLIGKGEVTQGQWEAVMGSNPSEFQGDDAPRGVEPSELPVESVSWMAAQEFAARTGLVLPTEAQWEYACRAGTEGTFSGTGNLGELGWYDGNSDLVTHVGGEKPPNQFGLHDMHGNVDEWCEDVYDYAFYSRPEALRPDPISKWGSTYRVRRGGGFDLPATECRSAVRGWWDTEGHFFYSNPGLRPTVSLHQDARLESELLDFGSLAPGGSWKVRLGLRNVGTAPLEVLNVALAAETSGEFTVVQWPKVIPPGDRGEVEVGYTPAAPGEDGGALRVETNDPAEPAFTVRLVGSGVAPPAARAIEGFTLLAANEQGFAEYRHDQTGIDFVYLPGGTFLMGAQAQDPQGPNPDAASDSCSCEGPVHEVLLSPFLMAKRELSQATWQAVMGSNPSFFQADELPRGVDAAKLPVEQVSWDDIQAFEEKTGLVLPTEAQWEYACRAGTRGPVSGTGRLDEMAWHAANSGERTQAVGTRASNQFGLHDLYGNVAEWCEDVLNNNYYEKPEARGPDPVSTTSGTTQIQWVVRGGSWSRRTDDCRSSARLSRFSDDRESWIGLRPVKRLP